MIWASLAAMVSAGFLSACYRLIRSEWPESYMSVSDYASYRKMTLPTSYIFFRFAPIFAVALFGVVNIERGDGNTIWFVVLLGIIHLSHTSGRAIWRLSKPSADSRRGPLLAMHAVVSALVAATLLCALLLRDPLSDLVPDWSDLLPELWGAAATAVLAVALIRATESKYIDPHEIAAEHRASIGADLWEDARALAEQANTDAEIVHSIMLAESIQRPKWFRRLERLKATVFRKGTYGLMQVSSDHAVSDYESVEIAVASHLAGRRLARNEWGQVEQGELEAIFATHNPSPEFIKLASDMFHFVPK